MVVNLAPGYANIMGKVKELENQTFTLEPADGSYPRIDTIVIERNDTDRDITAKVVTGQLSGNTPAPTPRVWENGVYQLVVAEIYVAAGATEVTQADITDKRSDPDVCGIVAGTVTEMDFSQFTAQFESYFEQFKASNLEEFSEWFEMIKGQLSEDAAGHLQNEIDAINAKIPSGASTSNKLATESEIATINDNLSGFKFYPTDTGIVGLIADDSAYTDEDGNYIVWGTATANQLVEDNPNTYKSVPSTEDCRGEAGADTAIPFSEELQGADKLMNGITSLTITLSKKYKVFQVYAHPNAGFSADRLIFQINGENISPILKVSNCFTVFYEASVGDTLLINTTNSSWSIDCVGMY
jgi:hypothetical protein